VASDLGTSAPYTSGMAPSPNPLSPQVGILVFEDDPYSGTALRQILDSEGWRVRVVPDTKMLQAELKTGEYSLLIANIAMVGAESALFQVLRELASVSVEDGARLRVLFVVPEMTGNQFVSAIEEARLPYVLRPFHLHDFLEKVSDLLVEVKAIEGPLRMTRYEFGAARKKKKAATKTNSMFASRESYSYTEEELAEYEKQEAATSLSRKNKNRNNLGNSRG
jgi:DNA-binding response OmpR family regulator